MKKKIIIVSNTSDNPFAIDVAYHFGQRQDISDLVSLKDFQNTEFCPRFISGENDLINVGDNLKGKTVIIVSTSSSVYTRNSLAMRNLLIARAAKDNGAKEVLLIEPDLFYSCQDRGPKENQFYSSENKKRSITDRKKFNGQPFSAYLYANILQNSGVNRVLTVHNHSEITREIFSKTFKFDNIIPVDVFAHYLAENKVVDKNNLVFCAPDKGAKENIFLLRKVFPCESSFIRMYKLRSGERNITMKLHKNSLIGLEEVKGKDVVVFDDMIRTGGTIIHCCRLLKKHNPRKIIFCVTHFHSSQEVRENLSDGSLDEIITTNTIPSILNRDTQGRLRRKLVVLKIEKMIAQVVANLYGEKLKYDQPYMVDISSKNPRSRYYNN